MKPSFRSDQDRDADSHQFSQGRNRGHGHPPLLHERSNYGQESAIGWGPFGSGPRFGGEEKKGSKASRTGPGQGGRAASPGFSTNDRMRVLLGCQGGVAWDVGFGVWKLGIRRFCRQDEKPFAGFVIDTVQSQGPPGRVEPDVQWEDSDGWGVCHMGLKSMINLH